MLFEIRFTDSRQHMVASGESKERLMPRKTMRDRTVARTGAYCHRWTDEGFQRQDHKVPLLSSTAYYNMVTARPEGSYNQTQWNCACRHQTGGTAVGADMAWGTNTLQYT
eukprot:scaffold976_cov161-Amphora_coffeaeformis.AAC.4